jgi:predicted dehydrogenase
MFRGVKITACADIDPAAAGRRAAEFGLRCLAPDALIADADIDLVLNLTVPAAHFDVSMRALLAGKHVFTEKPLAITAEAGRQLVETARDRDLAIGSAPDTFLGAAGQTARDIIDTGQIGTPVIGTAFMMGRGMEHWHPSPEFYYQPGAGPVMDMGPYYLTMLVNLLGPVQSVQSLSTSGQRERLISADGPKRGTRFPVGTPTSALALLRFAGGAIVTFGASWDVYRHSNQPIELHGTAGSLRLPDPDNFGGIIGVSQDGAPWVEMDMAAQIFGAANWPVEAPDRANYRMLGVADLAQSLSDRRTPRASGELALHVLEMMEAILEASETATVRSISSSVPKPRVLTPEDARRLLV